MLVQLLRSIFVAVACLGDVFDVHAIHLKTVASQQQRNASAGNVDDLLQELLDLPFDTDLTHILHERGLVIGANQAARSRLGVKPTLWVHVHKAGGTFMCLMASLAGESIVQPNENCNFYNDGYQRSGEPSQGMSCAERKETFAGYTWGQIERELWESDKCWDDFNYGVMLREPLQLMRSMMNYHPDIGKRFLTNLEDELAAGSGDTPDNQFALWKYLDNFHVRVLAAAMDVPAGQITESHLTAARELLGNFSAVGRLEDLPSRGDELFSKLNWPSSMMDHVGQVANPSGSGIDFTTEEETWLRELNKYDYALYADYGSV